MATDPDTSASVLHGIQTGDHAAWERFVSIYSPVLYKKCRAKGFSETDARDIAQDVFVKVHNAIGTFDWQPGMFRRWFSVVVKNALIDYSRAAERAERPSGGTDMQVMLNELAAEIDEDTSFSDQDSDHVLIVQQTLQLIKRDFEPRVWQAFWLTNVEGLPAADAGNRLEMKENNVRQASFRVRRRLREELDGLLKLSDTKD